MVASIDLQNLLRLRPYPHEGASALEHAARCGCPHLQLHGMTLLRFDLSSFVGSCPHEDRNNV